MAKRSNENGGETGKSKIRFIYAEVEGSDQSLQSLMGTMAAAMGRPTVANHHRALTVARSEAVQQNGDAPPIHSADETLQTAGDRDAPQEDAAGPNPAAAAASDGKRLRGDRPKTDRNTGLTPIGDLDLMPKGKKSLSDFTSEKDPRTDEDHVLLFVYYLTQIATVSPINVNHILTCFKAVSRKVPADLRQTIRNIAKKRAWISSDMDDLKTTTVGENYVEHTLGKVAAVDGRGSRGAR